MKKQYRFGGKMKKITFTLLLFIAFINIFAYSFLDYNIGNRINNTDPRSRAMGGSGVAAGQNLLDATNNPANISNLPKILNFQFSLGTLKFDEDRSTPMYNFFDSYIDDATYSSNVNLFYDFSGALSYRNNFGLINLTSALAFYPIMSFDANYEEQVRNDDASDYDTYPEIIAQNFKEGKGKLNAYSLINSIQYVLSDQLKGSIGLELAQLKGSNNQKTRITWSEYAIEQAGVGVLPDSSYACDTDISGMMFKMGANISLNDRLNVGFSYQPKFEGETTITLNGTELTGTPDYILPSTMKIGLSYSPRNPYKTNFQADVEFVNNEDISKFLNNSMNLFIGMEHYIGKATPLRMGFRFETSPFDKSIGMPTITTGTGFNLASNLRFDISGEFSNRKYDALDLFHDSYYDYAILWNYIKPTDRGWENPDKVDETFAKIQTGLTYTW